MARYIINRLIHLIPVLIIMSILTFSLTHLAPGDPVDYILGIEATDEMRDELRKELGLDKNILIQYFTWAGKFLKGDLGRSVVNKVPVLDLILEKLPATIMLAVAAVTISTLIGLILGVIAASRQGSVTDLTLLIFSLLWVSIPSFWLAILLVLCFSLNVPIFPAMGYTSLFVDVKDALHHLALPAFCLGAVGAGAVTRMVRSEMIEQLNQDYITTAWSKGLSRQAILYGHALRNALLPVVTYIAVQLGTYLGGTMVIEQIFAWPGVGRLVIQAVFARDYPLVQGVVLLMSLIFVGINLLVDISYTFLNPKVRFGEKE